MPDNQIDRFKKFQRNSEQSLNKLLEVNGFSSREDFKNKVKSLNTYSKTFSFEIVKDDLTATNIEHVSNMYDKYDAYINFIDGIADILVDITDMSGFSYDVTSKTKLDKIASITLNIEKSRSFLTMDVKKIISRIDVINSTMGVEFILSDMNISKLSFILKFIKDTPKPIVRDKYKDYYVEYEDETIRRLFRENSF